MGSTVIAFVGASHSGKTSLLRGVANRAYKNGVSTQEIRAYGYDILQKFIKKGHTLLQVADYQTIFDGQAQVEERGLKDPQGVILLENPLISCYPWCLNNAIYHGVYRPQEHKPIFSRMSHKAIEMAEKYDFIFYLPVTEQSLQQKARQMNKMLNFEQILHNDETLYSYAIQTKIVQKQHWYKIDPYDREGNRIDPFQKVLGILDEFCPMLRFNQEEQQMFEQAFLDKPKRAGN